MLTIYFASPQTPHFFTGCQERLQRSLSLNPAILKHNNVIGSAQDSVAMRDSQARGAGGKALPEL